MRTENKKIFLGLAFPNALMFGFALIFFGCFGLYRTFWNQIYEINTGLVIKAFFLFISCILGLIPFTSTKYIVIDSENIYSFNSLYSMIKVGRTLAIKDYNRVIIRKAKKVFKIEAGLRPTAKSEYSLKFYDILLRDKIGNDTMLAENISSHNKTQKALNEILQATNYEY